VGSVVERQALDLLWSLWTELGVPGTTRDHPGVVLDPEPLLVISPFVMRDDARLRDEVFRWSVAHADRISTSRLQGLLRRARPQVQAAFGAFAATLDAAADVRWPRDPSAKPWSRAPAPRAPELPLTRPSLARLRVRAVAGVGARADVLAELLARPSTWATASDLEHLGYSKRNIARVLSELADAGVVRQRAERNARAFQVLRADLWADLLALTDLSWPRWDLLLGLLVEALALRDVEPKSAAVRRVEATQARDRMSALADALGAPSPPATRGVQDPLPGLTA
jgi:hypothetical protein